FEGTRECGRAKSTMLSSGAYGNTGRTFTPWHWRCQHVLHFKSGHTLKSILTRSKGGCSFPQSRTRVSTTGRRESLASPAGLTSMVLFKNSSSSSSSYNSNSYNSNSSNSSNSKSNSSNSSSSNSNSNRNSSSSSIANHTG
ncbi:unnamed protein product, partial [Ectocarpus fasciculatus]